MYSYMNLDDMIGALGNTHFVFVQYESLLNKSPNQATTFADHLAGCLMLYVVASLCQRFLPASYRCRTPAHAFPVRLASQAFSFEHRFTRLPHSHSPRHSGPQDQADDANGACMSLCAHCCPLRRYQWRLRKAPSTPSRTHGRNSVFRLESVLVSRDLGSKRNGFELTNDMIAP